MNSLEARHSSSDTTKGHFYLGPYSRSFILATILTLINERVIETFRYKLVMFTMADSESQSPLKTLKDSMKNNWRAILSGVLLASFFLLLAFVINSNLNRGEIPSFENNIIKAFALGFLGLSSGYNLAMSQKNSNKAYFFYSGILLPILFVAFLSSLFSTDVVSPILMVIGVLFPVVFLPSGLVEEHDKFVLFVNWFSKYVPTFVLLNVGVNDYLIALIQSYFQFDLGAWTYIPTLILVFFLMFIVDYIKSPDDYRRRRGYY